MRGGWFLCGLFCVPLLAQAAPPLTLAGAAGTEGAKAARPAASPLADAEKLAFLRKRIRYVFILFQENRSFDHYFGTYPGANGLYTSFPGADPADPAQRAAKNLGSYRQLFWQPDGKIGSISPFLIPRMLVTAKGARVPLYPEDIATVDHSHTGMVAAMHTDRATRAHPRNDAYAINMEGLAFAGDESAPATLTLRSGSPVAGKPSLPRAQMGELVMAHVDCDTVPFLWQLADRFTLFDNFHQTTIGPSTPNAIAMIAGQTGETQWALHPDLAGSLGAKLWLPNATDSGPFAGSPADTTPGPKPPYGPDMQSFGPPQTAPAPLAPIAGQTLHTVKLKGLPGAYKGQQPPLTFASLPLAFMGRDVMATIAKDENPDIDLADLRDDLPVIKQTDPVSWGWYQQGYDAEPFDGAATVDLFPASTPRAAYVVHHNGPQYFGYLGDNPAVLTHMHGLERFRQDVAAGTLPGSGGVFYVRGGYYNNDALRTLDPNPDVRATFAGNDDHPGYADSQISEAAVADSVNAIAASRYWPESAIIVVYDETDGLYDHAPELIRSWGPDGLPLAGGPRIPAILISPYAVAHGISHVYSEHSAVIRFLDALFGLTPLADLPVEKQARGRHTLKAPDGTAQENLGPADDFVPMGNLFEAFDNDRLTGRAPPLSPAYARIEGVRDLPHRGGAGCKSLRITPTDYPNGLNAAPSDPPPANFNPRPVVTPGLPASGDWVP